MDWMSDDSSAPSSGLAGFAARHARATLVTAYLLTGEWPTARDAAAHALVAGWRASTGDLGSDGRHACAVALARRHAHARAPVWSRGGGLHLQELGTQPTAAVDDPDELWSALGQLTEQERAAVVLRSHLRLDAAAIPAALGRSQAAVERDLGVAFDVVAHAARPSGRDAFDVESGLRAFFAAHDDLRPDTAAVEQRAAVLATRRKRSRYATAAVTAAVALAVVVTGVIATRPDAQPAATHGTYIAPTGPPAWLIQPRSRSLPDLGPHRKLVGFQTVMVVVPASWTQVAAKCGKITENSVVFPTAPHAALCGDDDVPRGLSAVSFNRDISGEPEVEGDFGPRRTHAGEFVVTRPRASGRYVAYTSAPDVRFGMSIVTDSRRTLNRIIDSISVIPAGYQAVPWLVGRPSEQAAQIASARGLVVDQRFRPGFVPVPLLVARQSKAVGTVLPANARVALDLVPR
jgi:DNA-directed RNA polymerase specialized sigma24 family protein